MDLPGKLVPGLTGFRPKSHLVAILAFALYGLGNAAFAGHDGSPLGLSFLRYFFGFLVVSILVAKSPKSVLAALGNSSTWALVVPQVVSNMAFMFSAKSVPLLVFVLFDAAIPALVALTAPLFGYRKLSKVEVFFGSSAMVSASLLVYLGGPSGSTPVSFGGLLLVVLGVISGAVALLTAPAATSSTRPVCLLWVFCAVGLVASCVVAVLGIDLRAGVSTVYSALFLALIAGGVGKLAIWRVSPKILPQHMALLRYSSVASSLVVGFVVLGVGISSAQFLVCGVLLVSVGVLSAHPTSLRPVPTPPRDELSR